MLLDTTRKYLFTILLLAQIGLFGWYIMYRFDATAFQAQITGTEERVLEYHSVYSPFLDPHNPYTQPHLSPLWGEIFETLVTEQGGRLEPGAVSSYTMVASDAQGSRWHIRLPDGRSFGDGQPAAMEDLLFSLQTAKRYLPGLEFASFYPLDASSMEIVTRDQNFIATLSQVYLLPHDFQDGFLNGSGSWIVRSLEKKGTAATEVVLVHRESSLQKHYMLSRSPYRLMARAMSDLRSGISVHLHGINVAYGRLLQPYCKLDVSRYPADTMLDAICTH